jgi:hypothetical protein
MVSNLVSSCTPRLKRNHAANSLLARMLGLDSNVRRNLEEGQWKITGMRVLDDKRIEVSSQRVERY